MLLRLTWLGCAMAASSLQTRPAPPEPRARQASEQIAGTVRMVKPEIGEIAVLTAVGHAIRLRVFHAGPECAITVAGAAARLREVTPGVVVVVRYHESEGRNEAESITTQSPEPTGRGG